MMFILGTNLSFLFKRGMKDVYGRESTGFSTVY